MRRAVLFVVATWIAVPVFAAPPIDGVEVIAGDSGVVAKIDRSPAVGPTGVVDPKAFALGFYRDGATLYEYRLGELVVKTDTLEILPDGVRWIKTSQMNGDTLQLETTDGQSYEFSVTTGEIRRLRKKYN